LGFVPLDEDANAQAADADGVVVEIGKRGDGAKKHRILVCRTDEQEEMARECALEDKFWE
jgi:acetate kinase